MDATSRAVSDPIPPLAPDIAIRCPVKSKAMTFSSKLILPEFGIRYWRVTEGSNGCSPIIFWFEEFKTCALISVICAGIYSAD